MRTYVAVVLMLAPLVSGCCVFRGTCTNTPGQVATVVVDCARESVQEAAQRLAPTVAAIVAGGAPDWQAQLDSLAHLGLEVVSCALQHTPPEALHRVTAYLTQAKRADGSRAQVYFTTTSTTSTTSR